MKVKRKYLKSRKEKFLQGLKIAFVLIILFGIGFTYINLKNLIISMDYSMNNAISKKKKLLREKEKLKNVILYLHSPSYLGKKGRELGMVELKISDIKEIK